MELSTDALASVAVFVPPLQEQRAIADYLDHETARIDAVVAALRRANALLDQWLESITEQTVWGTGAATVPLMHLTPTDRQIQYGIVLPGPHVPEGPRIVKGGDIVTGSLSAEGLCRTTFEIEREFARSRLKANDVVFAIRGAIGACALVPEDVAGANITQDVARVSPRSDVEPDFLLFVLRSRTFQGAAEARVVGATIRGLNIRDLKRVRVPLLTQSTQRSLAGRLREAQQHRDDILSRRQRQIELLLERRQALITAAVTGQFEVPGVAA